MTRSTLLVFPLDVDAARPFIANARALGLRIVGASSAMASPRGRKVDSFHRLPYVSDPDFDAALAGLVRTEGIDQVFAPHTGVWRKFDALRRTDPARYPFRLCEPDPHRAAQEAFEDSERWAEQACRDTLAAAIVPQPGARLAGMLSRAQYAGLHRNFVATTGQCDEDKLLSLCAIARHAPRGDIVEIGVLYGRSAVALGWLGQRHGIGSTICVDPWQADKLLDQGPAAGLVNAKAAQVDFNPIFRCFLASAALVGGIGYLRGTSTEAIAAYREAAGTGSLAGDELPTIAVSGRIAILHIDGNHRYDMVKADIALWSPHLCDGGWLLLDDYVWAFGDGPCRAGDELLGSGHFDTAFVAGGTLFLRKAHAATAGEAA